MRDYSLCPDNYTLHSLPLSGSLNIPEGITSIGRRAFYNQEIEQVSLPSTLKQIGPAAFWGCDELNHLILPSNIEYIGPDAFRKCIKLSNVVIEESTKLQRIESGVFLGCNLTAISLPDGISSLEDSCFRGNPYLKSAELPRSLNTIKQDIFTGCSLKQIKYAGTREDFQQINIDQNWLGYAGPEVKISCSDGLLLAKPRATELIDVT